MNGKRILIIEDNLNDAELLRSVLHVTGWHIETVREAAAAQRALDRNQFAFAFVDLSIPGMDGPSMIRWIKEHHPAVPIAIVSGYSEQRKMAELMDCGAVFTFPKPFTSQDLKYILNFMDVMEAIFKQGAKLKPSWITNVAGVLAVGFGAWSFYLHRDPTSAGMIVLGLGMIGALDQRALKLLLSRKS